jgi:hypothetical protein
MFKTIKEALFLKDLREDVATQEMFIDLLQVAFLFQQDLIEVLQEKSEARKKENASLALTVVTLRKDLEHLKTRHHERLDALESIDAKQIRTCALEAGAGVHKRIAKILKTKTSEIRNKRSK